VRPLRLVLVRHAQSTANAADILDTRLPGSPLTEQGRQQAAELARRLAYEPVTAVYASRALRARQTAEPIAARHQLAVRVLDGVHEAFLGVFEGRHAPEAHQAWRKVYRAWHCGELDLAPPGGESGRQVLERYLAAVATIRCRHTGGTAVLISHGAASRLAVTALASNINSRFAEACQLPNAATVVLEADRAGWRCLRWDSIELG
jgi:broad specificity phosphatase PhoE